MQAIETKFLGPTNFRGARIKATADAGSITIPWDHAMNVEDNHRAAIRAFVERMGWHGTWVVGATRGGFVGVCAKREHRGHDGECKS